MNTVAIRESCAVVPAINMETLKDRFLAFVQVKDVTGNSYEVALRDFMFWIHQNGISQPQRTDIYEYVKYLDTPHKRRPRTDRPNEKSNVIHLSAGTQARYLRAVKMFFRWTANEGLYPNIADNVKGAKVRADNTKRDPLGRQDAQKLLSSIDRSTTAGKRDYAMILLSITAGLRIIEIQRANVGNMEIIAGEKVLFIQGKGHDEADAYKKLTPEVFNAITDYLKTRNSKSADCPLFAGTGHRNNEGRLTEPSISRIIKNRMKEAGYNTHRISAHSLRHTSVTMLLESGATIQQAQAHARHASPETTGIYAHNIDQKKEHPEQRIYNFLFNIESDVPAQATELFTRMTPDKQNQALAILQAIAA